ncbi:MAG: type I-E CRISPR-associated protein Cas5/CasD [Bacteroidota bacterium]
MTDHLLFQLYGPFASWGEIAVGEIRPTADHPTKSAVLGIVGAALGLRREQEREHRSLAEGLLYAVEVYRSGLLLRDFHTVQVPEKTLPAYGRTRADALRHAKDQEANPLVSYREYRSDPYTIVALRVRSGVSLPWSLADLKAHLKRPRFPLYLGRKACPPALPLCPVILSAVRFADAFKAARHREEVQQVARLIHGNKDGPRFAERLAGKPDVLSDVFWEGDPDEWPGEAPVRTERWDHPTSRTRWEFAPRSEWVLRRLETPSS